MTWSNLTSASGGGFKLAAAAFPQAKGFANSCEIASIFSPKNRATRHLGIINDALDNGHVNVARRFGSNGPRGHPGRILAASARSLAIILAIRCENSLTGAAERQDGKRQFLETHRSGQPLVGCVPPRKPSSPNPGGQKRGQRIGPACGREHLQILTCPHEISQRPPARSHTCSCK